MSSLTRLCYGKLLFQGTGRWGKEVVNFVVFWGFLSPITSQRFFFLHSFLLCFSLWSYQRCISNLKRCDVPLRAVWVLERGISGDLNSKSFPFLLCIAENCNHSGFSFWLSIILHHILAQSGWWELKEFQIQDSSFSLNSQTEKIVIINSVVPQSYWPSTLEQ